MDPRKEKAAIRASEQLLDFPIGARGSLGSLSAQKPLPPASWLCHGWGGGAERGGGRGGGDMVLSLPLTAWAGAKDRKKEEGNKK